VGISTDPNRRYREHLRKANDPRSSEYEIYKSRWLRKLMASGVKPLLVIIDSGLDLQTAQRRECDLIAALPGLVNTTAGGETNQDHILPPEQQVEFIRRTLGQAWVAYARIRQEDPERWADIQKKRIEAMSRSAAVARMRQQNVQKAQAAAKKANQHKTEK